jgi:hypothetical protein
MAGETVVFDQHKVKKDGYNFSAVKLPRKKCRGKVPRDKCREMCRGKSDCEFIRFISYIFLFRKKTGVRITMGFFSADFFFS